MNEYERQNPELAGEPVPADQGSTRSTNEPDNWRPAEIEREIQMTRERMGENIDELSDRLSPQNLKAQAKNAIEDAAANAVQNVGEQARRTGYMLVDMIRENPLPVIAVGAAATWLLTKRSPQGPVSGDRMARYAYTGPERRSYLERQREGGIARRVADKVTEARERATDVASNVSERASEMGARARQQSVRVKSNLEHTIEESPLVVALGAAVLGLAVGLLLPRTEQEDEMLGPARDRLVDRAEVVAERVKDATVVAGREVADTVQDQIDLHKPAIKGVAQEVAQRVKDQVKSSADRIKTEAKEAARDPIEPDPDEIDG